MRVYLIPLVAIVAAAFSTSCSQTTRANPKGENEVQVVFSGGHETDERDKGRPVVLIANALGVKPEVFRDAFSHVHPAPAAHAPDDERVHENKRVLLDSLGPYGITNERLDEVSDYYRYNRSRGEMWTTTQAEAYALVKNGKITGFRIANPGNGYSSLPQVSVPGFKQVPSVTLSWSKKFESNGSIAQISLTKTNST